MSLRGRFFCARYQLESHGLGAVTESAYGFAPPAIQALTSSLCAALNPPDFAGM